KDYSEILWKERLGEFALVTDGTEKRFHYQRALEYLPNESSLHWILNLGILQEVEQGLLKFSTELTKSHYASQFTLPYIKGEITSNQKIYDMIRHTDSPFRNRMMTILKDFAEEEQINQFFSITEGVTNG